MPWNVHDHGATGNGGGNDAPAIQSAIDACSAAGGGTVIVPAGNYVCLGGLTITNGGGIAPVRLVGEGYASRLVFERDVTPGPFAEAIRIGGPTASGCGMADLELQCASGKGFSHGVHVTGAGSTEYVSLEGLLVGGFPIGIGIGCDTTTDVAEVSLSRCMMDSATTAGIQLGNGLSSGVVNHRMWACVVVRCGVGVSSRGSAFCWRDGTAEWNGIDFGLSVPNTAPVVIDGVRSEHSGGFLKWTGGARGAVRSPWPTVL